MPVCHPTARTLETFACAHLTSAEFAACLADAFLKSCDRAEDTEALQSSIIGYIDQSEDARIRRNRRLDLLRLDPKALAIVYEGFCRAANADTSQIAGRLRQFVNDTPGGDAFRARRILAERIRNARTERNLSQEDVAARAGWNRKTVMRLEGEATVTDAARRDILQSLDIEDTDISTMPDPKTPLRVRITQTGPFEKPSIPFGAVVLDLRHKRQETSPAWSPFHSSWLDGNTETARVLTGLLSKYRLGHLDESRRQIVKDIATVFIESGKADAVFFMDTDQRYSIVRCGTSPAARRLEPFFYLGEHEIERLLAEAAVTIDWFSAATADAKSHQPDLTPRVIDGCRHLTILVDADEPRFDLAVAALVLLVAHGLPPRMEIEGTRAICDTMSSVLSATGLPEPGIITATNSVKGMETDTDVARRIMRRLFRDGAKASFREEDIDKIFFVVTPTELTETSFASTLPDVAPCFAVFEAENKEPFPSVKHGTCRTVHTPEEMADILVSGRVVVSRNQSAKEVLEFAGRDEEGEPLALNIYSLAQKLGTTNHSVDSRSLTDFVLSADTQSIDFFDAGAGDSSGYAGQKALSALNDIYDFTEAVLEQMALFCETRSKAEADEPAHEGF